MADISGVADEVLVREAIGGNQSAFAQLYDKHFDKIYRYVYLKVGIRVEAEDLTQEVFLKALGAISSYKWRQVPFSSWLFRIAHNEVIDYFRKQKKKEKTHFNNNVYDTKEDPVMVAESSFEKGELMAALQKLSPAQREVISLRFSSELSIAEVAKTLGKREGTVKALQDSATVALRKILSKKKNG